MRLNLMRVFLCTLMICASAIAQEKSTPVDSLYASPTDLDKAKLFIRCGNPMRLRLLAIDIDPLKKIVFTAPKAEAVTKITESKAEPVKNESVTESLTEGDAKSADEADTVSEELVKTTELKSIKTSTTGLLTLLNNEFAKKNSSLTSNDVLEKNLLRGPDFSAQALELAMTIGGPARLKAYLMFHPLWDWDNEYVTVEEDLYKTECIRKKLNEIKWREIKGVTNPEHLVPDSLALSDLSQKRVLSLGEGESGLSPYLSLNYSGAVHAIGIDISDEYKNSSTDFLKTYSSQLFYADATDLSKPLENDAEHPKEKFEDSIEKIKNNVLLEELKNPFDHVISSALLCELPYAVAKKALLESLRVLKMGGTSRHMFLGTEKLHVDSPEYAQMLLDVRTEAETKGYGIEIYDAGLVVEGESTKGPTSGFMHLLVMKKVPLAQ